MVGLYGDDARHFQDRFDSRRLADRLEQTIVRNALTEEDQTFVRSRDFFFLATIDDQGWPHCSYKGGAPGFLQVLDAGHLAFPCYDGNGMYLSMGNLRGNGKLGLLLIDFEEPKRMRINGTAEIREDDPLLAEYHEAELVIRVTIERLWPNCPRYIHPHRREAQSPFVPKVGQPTPIPEWKTFEFVADVLPRR
jgi:predicted pyridoxine 5'-phosphate oxidase superfamily flavin-nucleotide-binding protein